MWVESTRFFEHARRADIAPFHPITGISFLCCEPTYALQSRMDICSRSAQRLMTFMTRVSGREGMLHWRRPQKKRAGIETPPLLRLAKAADH